MKKDQSNPQFSRIHLAAKGSSATPAGQLRDRLAELAERLDRPHNLNKGQFVKWKTGLKNKSLPDYGEPAIVRSVMSNPIFDPSEDGAGSPYFQEPLTLVIGVFADDDLLEFRVDGRRFEPFDNEDCIDQ